MYTFLSFILAVLLVTVLLAIFYYLLSMFTTELITGVPLLCSSPSQYKKALDFVKPKKGQLILDLGFGTGKVLRYATRKFNLNGVGYESNPMLIPLAKTFNFLLRYKNITLKHGDIFKIQNFNEAHIIYIFLYPALLTRLAPLITKNCKKGTTIISHGFPLPGFDSKLIRDIKAKPFPTYIYKN